MSFPNQDAQWKAGQSGNPSGRPKKIFTILKQSGYAKDEIKDAFHELGWLNEEELLKLSLNDDSPAIVKVVAAAYKQAIKKGDYRYVREIIEQVIGRPPQEMKIEGEMKTRQVFKIGDNEIEF